MSIRRTDPFPTLQVANLVVKRPDLIGSCAIALSGLGMSILACLLMIVPLKRADMAGMVINLQIAALVSSAGGFVLSSLGLVRAKLRPKSAPSGTSEINAIVAAFSLAWCVCLWGFGAGRGRNFRRGLAALTCLEEWYSRRPKDRFGSACNLAVDFQSSAGTCSLFLGGRARVRGSGRLCHSTLPL